jgi:vacuolar-type H+-ATPase subunit H
MAEAVQDAKKAVEQAVDQAVQGVKDLAVDKKKEAKPKKEKVKKGGDADGRPLVWLLLQFSSLVSEC